jgi:EAL domain-containing protein (putative c-di-GMP-specific phosphodiesterase class I)
MDYAIVDAINRISHILGMQTVAESVESAEILEKLTELKIDFAQGYFIAEPEALGTPGIVPPVQLQLHEV